MNNNLLVMPYLNKSVVKLLSPSTLATLKEGHISNDGLAAAVATSNNTIFYNFWGSMNYGVSKAANNNNFYKCGCFFNTFDSAKHLRADMDKITGSNNFMQALSASGENPNIITVFNVGGYHIATIIAPDEEELQGVFCYGEYLYVLYSYGQIYKCLKPAVISTSMNALTSHTQRATNLKIFGYIVPDMINGTLPNIPYSAQMSYLVSPRNNMLNGLYYRWGNYYNNMVNIPSSSAGPFLVPCYYIPTGSSVPTKRIDYRLDNDTGVLTMYHIYDIANETDTAISSMTDYNNYDFTGFGTIRWLFFGNPETCDDFQYAIGSTPPFNIS